MEHITKSAIITDIKEEDIVLKISSCSACHTCSAKGFCSMSETKDKFLTIKNDNTLSYHIGEEVNLEINSSQGLKSVFYGYGLPLILLLFVVFFVNAIFKNDIYSGISGIIILIPYYFGLFLLKDRLKSDFKFKISKKNNS